MCWKYFTRTKAFSKHCCGKYESQILHVIKISFFSIIKDSFSSSQMFIQSVSRQIRTTVNAKCKFYFFCRISFLFGILCELFLLFRAVSAAVYSKLGWQICSTVNAGCKNLCYSFFCKICFLQFLLKKICHFFNFCLRQLWQFWIQSLMWKIYQ